MSNFSDLVNDKSLQSNAADIAVVSLDDDGIAVYDESGAAASNLPSGFTKSSIAAHKWYDDYSDTSYSIIDSTTKKVTVDKSQTNITQEQNSQFIPFKASRYYDGIDLSVMTITIHFVNANGDDYIATAVNVCYSDSELRFAWLVDEYATSVAGSLSFEIIMTGTKSDLTYILRTQPNDSLTVLSSLSGNNTISPQYGWDNYITTITKSVTSAAQYATNAQTSASKAENSANEAATSASNASNSATKSEASAVKSASSATESEASAKKSASSATESATSATKSATSATESASSATKAAGSAKESADSASAASSSEGKAKTYAENALTSQTNAAQSATSAGVSQSAAETAAKSAASSSIEALTSASKAATSEQNANTYMTNAKTSQTEAAKSASAAQVNATELSNKIDTVEEDIAQGAMDSVKEELQTNYYTKEALNTILDNLETATFTVVGETLVIKTK